MKTFSTPLLVSAAAMAVSVHGLSSTFDLLDHTSQLNYYHVANSAYTAAQTKLPADCAVDQVHLVSRHTTRYPSTGSYNGLVALQARFKNAIAAGIPIVGSELQFIKTWNLSDVITNSAAQVENITALGLDEGKALGKSIRETYPSLYNSKMTVWTGNVQRVVLTAKSFMDGYFGTDALASNYSNLIITNSTDKTLGGNTLLPIDTCPKFVTSLANTPSATFTATFLPAMTARLETLWPGFNFTTGEALGMMDLCMYEMNLLSKTQRRFCNIYTDEDWVNYAYNKDIGYYYGSSYGNPLARVVGYPYIEAVSGLLAQTTTPFCQKVFVGFSHDTQINAFISALGLAYDETFPATAVNATRNYRSSRLVTMGGHLVTERIKCGTQRYVRVSVNDAVHPLSGCQSGPGLSCPLEEYTARIAALNSTIGDFVTKCGVTSGASGTFALFDQPLKNQCTATSC